MSADTAPATTDAASTTTAPTGDPLAVGLPGFVVGSVALGLQLTGFVSAAAAAAPLAIILGASAVCTLIATIWAARLGQNAVAAVFGVFAGFWASYAGLVLGLTHGWLPVPLEDIQHTQALFLISWLVVVGVLTLGSLRLPLSFTAVLALVDLTLVLQIVGVLDNNAGAAKASGYAALGFAAIGAYLFLGTVRQATGGQPLPLGRPVVTA